MVDEIKTSIRNWNDVRNTTEGLDYLCSGFGFEISRIDYQNWTTIFEQQPEEEGQFLNVYLGVKEARLEFHLVDSHTDGNELYEDNGIITVEYKRSAISSNSKLPISVKVNEDSIPEMERSFKWMLYTQEWFNSKRTEALQDDQGIVRVFQVPFSDLHGIFEKPENIAAFFFMGIKEYENLDGHEDKNDIELLLCNKSDQDYAEANIFRDVTTPCPPFSMGGKGFNLL